MASFIRTALSTGARSQPLLEKRSNFPTDSAAKDFPLRPWEAA